MEKQISPSESKDQKVTVKFGDYTCEYTASCGSFPIIYSRPEETERIFRQCFNEFMHKVFKGHAKDYALRDFMRILLSSRELPLVKAGDKLRSILNG